MEDSDCHLDYWATASRHPGYAGPAPEGFEKYSAKNLEKTRTMANGGRSESISPRSQPTPRQNGANGQAPDATNGQVPPVEDLSEDVDDGVVANSNVGRAFQQAIPSSSTMPVFNPDFSFGAPPTRRLNTSDLQYNRSASTTSVQSSRPQFGLGSSSNAQPVHPQVQLGPGYSSTSVQPSDPQYYTLGNSAHPILETAPQRSHDNLSYDMSSSFSTGPQDAQWLQRAQGSDISATGPSSSSTVLHHYHPSDLSSNFPGNLQRASSGSRVLQPLTVHRRRPAPEGDVEGGGGVGVAPHGGIAGVGGHYARGPPSSTFTGYVPMQTSSPDASAETRNLSSGFIQPFQHQQQQPGWTSAPGTGPANLMSGPLQATTSYLGGAVYQQPIGAQGSYSQFTNQMSDPRQDSSAFFGGPVQQQSGFTRDSDAWPQHQSRNSVFDSSDASDSSSEALRARQQTRLRRMNLAGPQAMSAPQMGHQGEIIHSGEILSRQDHPSTSFASNSQQYTPGAGAGVYEQAQAHPHHYLMTRRGAISNTISYNSQDSSLGATPDDDDNDDDAGEQNTESSSHPGKNNMSAHFMTSIEYHQHPDEIFRGSHFNSQWEPNFNFEQQPHMSLSSIPGMTSRPPLDYGRKPPAMTPDPEEGQRVVGGYANYYASVILYEIIFKETESYSAEAWLHNIVQGLPLSQEVDDHPRPTIHGRFVHWTRGFIAQGSAFRFIVIHNATNPWDPHFTQPQTTGTTTVGTYGSYWFLHDEIHWNTFKPCLRPYFNFLKQAGYIREIARWNPTMSPREKRFHRGYWLCANRHDLGGLLNRAAILDVADPEQVEDNEPFDFTESDLDNQFEGALPAASLDEFLDLLTDFSTAMTSVFTLDHFTIGDPDEDIGELIKRYHERRD